MRIRRFLSTVTSAALVLGAARVEAATSQAANSEESVRADRADRVERGLRPRVPIEGEPDWTLRERMERYRVPGVSIAVFRDFRLAWARGYGIREAGHAEPVTPATVFQAASIGKPVTAAAVLALSETGKLSLDADVNTILRSWKVPESEFTHTKPVTARQLLSHSAGTTVQGFPGYASGEPVPTLLQILKGERPANTDPIVVDQEPGKQVRYSGGGYMVLQQAIEDVSSMPYGRFVEERVLSPLGMGDSAFATPPGRPLASGHRPDGSVLPGGYHVYPELGCGAALWTTPSDLARFALAVQRARRGDSVAALTRNAATLMTTKVTDQTGLGFFFVKERYFEHGGSNAGFVGRLVAHLDQGYGAVILTNSDNGGPLIDEILGSIAAEYGWENWQRDAPVRAVQVESAALERYAGRYRLGNDMLEEATIAPGGRLRVVPSFGEPFDLIPIGPDTFVRRDNPTRYRFAPGGERLERLSPTGQVWGTDARVAATATVALQHVEAGSIPMAVEAYRQLRAEEQPNDPTGSEEDMTDWGYDLLGHLDFRRAASILEVASALYPASVKIWFGLGEARLWTGRLEEAESAYRRALASAADDRVTPSSLRQMFVSEASSRLREIARRRRDGLLVPARP